jgi:hypothetical protein
MVVKVDDFFFKGVNIWYCLSGKKNHFTAIEVI